MPPTKAARFEYIEVFYNRKRPHLTFGYRSPVQLLENCIRDAISSNTGSMKLSVGHTKNRGKINTYSAFFSVNIVNKKAR
jgi:hypothetical protein